MFFFVRYINLEKSFYRFVTMHACDGQTDRRTEFSSLDRVCIACSAVKSIDDTNIESIKKYCNTNSNTCVVLHNQYQPITAFNIYSNEANDHHATMILECYLKSRAVQGGGRGGRGSPVKILTPLCPTNEVYDKA